MKNVIHLLNQKRLEHKRSANYFINEGLPGNAKHYVELSAEFGKAISILKAGNVNKA